MFLVVSGSDVHIDFDFAQPYYFACPIGRASKIAPPKNRACRSKFVQLWAKNPRQILKKDVNVLKIVFQFLLVDVDESLQLIL